MTGLDSIAMAAAHLESNDDDGKQKAGEETKSPSEQNGPIPASDAFVSGQPRLVSVGTAEPTSDNLGESAQGEAEESAATPTTPKKDPENTTHEPTSHDPTPALTDKTQTAEPPFSPLVPDRKQSHRPITLDLTTPPGTSQTMMMSTGFNGSGPHDSNMTSFSQHPARLPNQISQRILLKHQSVDGPSDDPIASLLSRISGITSDLPLLFGLMEQLCEIGVRDYGPPAEVVENSVPIEHFGRCDVLSGRGGETNHHYGNAQYRRIVKACQPAYLVAKRRDKPRIAAAIVRVIRSRSGRFLKKDAKDNLWRDVGNHKAREKCSQALREGAPELRNLVQLPEKQQTMSQKPSPQQQQGMGPRLTPSHVVYMDESTGQPFVRNVDGTLLSAMALIGSSPPATFGAYAGSNLPIANGGDPTAPTGALNSPGEIRAQLSGSSQAVYQQAVQQFEQIRGTKRHVPVATDVQVEEANKKPRAAEDAQKGEQEAANDGQTQARPGTSTIV